MSVRKAYAQNRNGWITHDSAQLNFRIHQAPIDPVEYLAKKLDLLADRGNTCRRTLGAPPLGGCRSAFEVVPPITPAAASCPADDRPTPDNLGRWRKSSGSHLWVIRRWARPSR